jgi:molybdate transport system substrate-binding protein
MTSTKSPFLLLALGLTVADCGGNGPATDSPNVVRVAVAGNFAGPQQELARLFQAGSGITVETSLGSTGQLYAQIANGAPYDVFLAADTGRPLRLEAEGHAVPGTRFTYAVGRAVLYAPGWTIVEPPQTELTARQFEHIAIANPEIAPYGAAAQAALERWGLWQNLNTRIVRAENVAQAFQFVESGAAEVGIVALSQVIERQADHYAILPNDLHRPIQQDAVLLNHGEHHAGARAFLTFLQSDEGRRVIADFGYAQR